MPRILRPLALILLAAVLPAAASALLHPRRPSWLSDEIPAHLAASNPTRYLMVDARPATDFATGHIPGAVSLNEDAWDALFPPFLDAWDGERPILVYCSSLSCATSREVAHRLRTEAGIPEVFVMEGGWEAWISAGGPAE